MRFHLRVRQPRKNWVSTAAPSGLAQISVADGRTDSWGITAFDEASGVIDIVTGLPKYGDLRRVAGCEPAGSESGRCGDADRKPDWLHHAQPGDCSGELATGSKDVAGTTTGLTEVQLFDEGGADSTESAYLVSICRVLRKNGTGKGKCSCVVVDSGIALPD